MVRDNVHIKAFFHGQSLIWDLPVIQSVKTLCEWINDESIVVRVVSKKDGLTMPNTALVGWMTTPK
uniref:Uncharacterized protein n=1 Tax=Romanomermis culicivorax TaxID=13658 RepID=A0A915J138_ROMCU